MAIDKIAAIGGAAAIASTASFMPQAIKIIRTRDTGSISTGMYAVTVLGFILWTTYGVLLGEWPIVASNGICLIFSAFILMMKVLPRPEKEKLADALEPVVAPILGEDASRSTNLWRSPS
jgi:MtN3 and saliva related transmembrane protein